MVGIIKASDDDWSVIFMLRRIFGNSKKLSVLFANTRRSLFIQTEVTPNENSLKFKPGKAVTGDDRILEFLTPREASRHSDLADDLFKIDGVKGVLFGKDFITVSKDMESEWQHVKPAVYAAIMDHLSIDKPILKANISGEGEVSEEGTFSQEDYEVVMMIKEILDTRIRPTVQGDGGDVQFMSFKDGIVELQLRGACRSCSSSTATLKHGIENMLMHYIPEVKEVRQAEDPAEVASQEYFDKLNK